MDSSVAWRGTANFAIRFGGTGEGTVRSRPYSPPGWFYGMNSIEPKEALSRPISERRGASAPAPAQDFDGGNVAWERTCPSMKVTTFPLLQ